VVRYLSLEWIDALRAEVAASDALVDVAAERRVGITQVVTDGPEGDVTYHLRLADGVAEFGAGPAEPEDVRFVQRWDTAVAVATGRMNAQEAFLGGHIALSGDRQALLDNQDVFGALDAVFATVRARTEYE
jgi:putative sterol carrier protein